MQTATELVKLLLQRAEVDVQAALKGEEAEVVRIRGRLQLAAVRTEVRCFLDLAHTRPAGLGCKRLRAGNHGVHISKPITTETLRHGESKMNETRTANSVHP